MNSIQQSIENNLLKPNYAKKLDNSNKKVSIVLKKYFIETKGFEQENFNKKVFIIEKNENNIIFFEKLKNYIAKKEINCFLIKNRVPNGYKWVKTRFYIESNNQIKMEFLKEINDVSKKNKIETLFNTIRKIEIYLNPEQQSKYIKGYLEYHNFLSFDEFVKSNF